MSVDLQIWGKSRGLDEERYPLVCHLLDAAAAMRILWRDVVSAGMRRWLARQMEVTVDHAGRLLEFWAGLHDIGKITPSFQRQVSVPHGYPLSPDDRKVGHDVAAHLWLASALQQAGYADGRRTPVARLVAQLLGGHHGCFHEVDPGKVRLEKRPYLGIGNGLWDEQRTATLKTVQSVLGSPEPPPQIGRDAAVLACGLIILADWLASQIPFIKRRLKHRPVSGDLASLRSFFRGSLAEAPKLVADAGLMRLRLRGGSFEQEFPFPPNALQAGIAEKLPGLVTGPGLLMIAAPMGTGKTETAFHAARIIGDVAGTSGIYVALPTMATADQMYRRLSEYLGRRSPDPAALTLLHGMAWLSPIYSMLEGKEQAEDAGEVSSDDEWLRTAVTEWLLGAKRGLLAPAAVGTIDQALLAVLPVRHNVLRMLGLAHKTVIIDEVHAFSPYMRKLLAILLSWLGQLGAPVVLLSATLPRHVAQELSAAYLGRDGNAAPPDLEQTYPSWTYVQRDMPKPVTEAVPVPEKDRRELAVSLRPLTIREGDLVDRLPALRTELQPLVEEGGCAAVICTTVAQAQETYRALRGWFADLAEAGHEPPELRLLHSRFPAQQREKITNKVIAAFGKNGKRAKPSVLVATQVIEQSLDVDFDLVISDLAPMELLLQRAGRGHRHKGNDKSRPGWAATPRLVVLTAPGGDTPRIPEAWKYVYPHASLIRAQRLLTKQGADPISIPDHVQGMVDSANPGDGIGPEDPLLEGFESAEIERIGANLVELQAADMLGIDTPESLKHLHRITDREVSEELVSTRFDADSVRVLPCFVDQDGTYRLGAADGPSFPQPNEQGRFTRAQRAAVMRHTIPLRAKLVEGRGEANKPPEEWGKEPHLQNLVLLPHRVAENGQIETVCIRDQVFLLDSEQGLLIEKK
ncbi:CRISPR-associated helicase/endonuclease Cas3 [Spinactinospora alkalitolerans]